MATRKDITESKYLTKDDCEPAIKVTVSHCTEENVALANQPPKMKYVLYFKEKEKGMVLNLTNFERIVLITGRPDTDNWTNAQLTLFNDPTVDFGGKLVGGIRVWVQQQVPNIDPAQQLPQGVTPVTNPDYVGDDPPPPTDDDIAF